MIMRAWILLPALALSVWAAHAGARPMPGRAEVEAAVNRWFACHTGTNCQSLLRRRLTAVRCQRLSDPGYPDRILCVFSGTDFRGAGR
jgi:hypothetical protein